MAKVNLCGVQQIDFENDQGQKIKGIKLHVSYPDDNVTGNACAAKFISQKLCERLGVSVESLEPLIGQVIQLDTDFKGKVTDISEVY